MNNLRNRRLSFAPGQRWHMVLSVLALALASPSEAAKAALTDEMDLPVELKLVPADGFGFISIRLANFWSSEANADLRKQIGERPLLAKQFEELQKTIGVKVVEIERVVVIFPDEEKRRGTVVAITTVKAFDRTELLAAVVPNSEEKKAGGKTYWASKGSGQAAHLVNNRTFLLGADEELQAFLGRPAEKKADSVLQEAIIRAVEKHSVVIGLPLAAYARTAGELNEKVKTLLPLLEAKSLIIVLDAGRELQADFRFLFSTEAATKNGEEAAEIGVKVMRKEIAESIHKWTRPPQAEGEGQFFVDAAVQFLKAADAALKDPKIQRWDKAIQISLRIKSSNAPAAVLLHVAGWLWLIPSEGKGYK